MEDRSHVPDRPDDPERPLVSIVIPVHNGGTAFQSCLLALQDSLYQDFELVVVDDGSTDDSARLATTHEARVLRHDRPLGPAAARNVGARAARGRFVFFLDADVVVHPDTLSRALAHFDRHPGLSALFGSYDDQPAAPGLVSQYRNLLHHYVHQEGRFEHNCRPAHTFWTGCGMIRRDVFLSLGGFDPELYRRPAIEDIEFGYRLARAGHPILLARDVLSTHYKRWSLAGVLKTDIFQRGVPWMLLMMRSQVVETDLNVSSTQRLCVATTGLGLASLPLAAFTPWAAIAFLVNLLVILVMNLPFYRFLANRKGLPFAIGAFPLHYLYFFCCGFSVVIATLLKVTTEHPPVPAHTRRIPRPALLRYARRRARSWKNQQQT